MRVYHTKDADRRVLKNKSIGIIGYGSQGRAQALNMRESGVVPLIGLPSRSRRRRVARADGFTVTTTRRLVSRSDILLFLAPDHLQGTIFETEICPDLRSGQMLVFAHAASVHFGAVRPPTGVDVVLIAPLGPGKRLRELFRQKPGVACFFGVFQDASGRAKKLGLALVAAIGCLRTGAIETTFAEEAVGDLFGEQAVLCGGLARLLKLGFDTLVENGLSPEKAYLECVFQIDLIVDLIKSGGIAGMLQRVSQTAARGAIANGPRIIDERARLSFQKIYREVESGGFFTSLVNGAPNGPIDYGRLTDAVFERAARRIGRMLGDRNA